VSCESTILIFRFGLSLFLSMQTSEPFRISKLVL
jgi:hypothetical protein